VTVTASTLPDVLARIQQLLPQPAQAPAQTQAAPAPTASFADVLNNSTAAPTTSGMQYGAEIDSAAQRYGLDPALIQSVIQQESGFDPNATSGAGAQGLMQLMPATAQSLGVTNPYDPAQAIDGGARLLRQNLDTFGGDTALALAAYNAGPGAVTRYGGVPPYPETQAYVQQILARTQSLDQTQSLDDQEGQTT
jgi:soluble lytic murein transglycosylase-like protein